MIWLFWTHDLPACNIMPQPLWSLGKDIYFTTNNLNFISNKSIFTVDKTLYSALPQTITPNPHINLLNVYAQIANKIGFQRQQCVRERERVSVCERERERHMHITYPDLGQEIQFISKVTEISLHTKIKVITRWRKGRSSLQGQCWYYLWDWHYSEIKWSWQGLYFVNHSCWPKPTFTPPCEGE
jgi:hypothetical protein